MSNNGVSLHHFMNTECYISIIVSTISFTILFVVLYYFLAYRIICKYFPHITKNEKIYWRIVNGFNSLINDLLIIILIIIFQKNKLTFVVTQEMIDLYTTDNERMIASIAIGYNIYDTIINCTIFSIQYEKKPDYIYIFHHFIMLIGLSMIVIMKHSASPLITALFFNEITNPILHINNIRNKLIDDSKPISSRTHFTDFLVKTIYFISFIIARFFILGDMMYQGIFTLNRVPIIIMIYAVIFYSICIFMLYLLQRDVIKSYRNYTETQYIMVDQQETATETDNEQQSQHNIHVEYDAVLQLSKKSVLQLFVAGIVYSFFHSNRMSIYLLYAQHFNPSNIQLAILLYGYNFWNGIASILYGSLANHYGYDRMLVILLMMQCIAVFLESVATNYYILLIGIILGQVSITYVVMGYIAWILPEKDAKIYTSYFYVAFVSSYLVSPLLAGFVSFYASNRMVFIINFIFCICAWIHSFIFIFNKQRNIEMQQLQIALIEEKDDNEQFPICLEQQNKRNEQQQQHVHKEKWYKLPNMTCFQLIMIISILIINSTVKVAETAVILFFPLYIIEEMNGNIIIGTSLIFVMIISFIIGNMMAPKWFDNKYKYWTISISLIILMFHMFYLIPMMTLLNMYWILMITSGFPLGLYSMVSEIILLEIQPTKYSGKINGAKGLIANWMKAFVMMTISLYWHIDHKICYYMTGIMFGVAFIFTLIMTIIKYIYF